MIRPEYKERAKSLVKAVKSLAVVSLFAMAGFVAGFVLFDYWFSLGVKPRVVNGIREPVCGTGIVMAAMGGAFLASIPGATLGAYVAGWLWWPGATWKFMLLFVAVALILLAFLIP